MIDIKVFKNAISLKSERTSADFNIILNNVHKFKGFSMIGFTLFLYPYGRDSNADSFTMLPYEEYVRDVNDGARSMYRDLGKIGDNIFGIFLGIAIFIAFWIFKKSDLFSIESVVSIFAAYTVGKEFWIDLDNGLTSLTQKWKLSWRDSTYYYIKQDFGSIQRFWKLARVSKYKVDTALATQIDFMRYSNSKTIELLFEKADLENIKTNETNLININFEKNISKSDDFMFGVKLILSKRKLFFTESYELFQVVNNRNLGTVDKDDNWVPDNVLVRKTINIGRLKLYLDSFNQKLDLICSK